LGNSTLGDLEHFTDLSEVESFVIIEGKDLAIALWKAQQCFGELNPPLVSDHPLDRVFLTHRHRLL
jgi:hypothetical protein